MKEICLGICQADKKWTLQFLWKQIKYMIVIVCTQINNFYFILTYFKSINIPGNIFQIAETKSKTMILLQKKHCF